MAITQPAKPGVRANMGQSPNLGPGLIRQGTGQKRGATWPRVMDLDLFAVELFPSSFELVTSCPGGDRII